MLGLQTLHPTVVTFLCLATPDSLSLSFLLCVELDSFWQSYSFDGSLTQVGSLGCDSMPPFCELCVHTESLRDFVKTEDKRAARPLSRRGSNVLVSMANTPKAYLADIAIGTPPKTSKYSSTQAALTMRAIHLTGTLRSECREMRPHWRFCALVPLKLHRKLPSILIGSSMHPIMAGNIRTGLL